MNAPVESRRPNIAAGPDFVIPEFPLADAAIIEDVFNLRNYTSAPLIPGARRREIFGHANPTGVQGPFQTNGFVVYTATPVEKGTSVEALVAPSPGMTVQEFLALTLSLVAPVLPSREDFPMPFKRITTAMSRVGLRAVAGMNMSVSAQDERIGFGSLFIPRKYMTGEFKGPGDPEPRHEFAIKLSAAMFATVTAEQLKALRAADENPPAPSQD